LYKEKANEFGKGGKNSLNRILSGVGLLNQARKERKRRIKNKE